MLLRGSLVKRIFAPVSALFVCLAAACAAQGPYVWVQDYKDAAPDAGGYRIAPGDVISVRVFNQDAMSGRSRVRPDGMVTLPFVNDVRAAGLTPEELSKSLKDKLKEFINAPVVTISLEEERPMQVSVLGEVAHPSAYAFERNAGVLQALAAAGGVTEYGHKDRIFVLRREGGPPTRVRFRFDALIHGDPQANAFRLRAGDVVVVE